MGHKVTVLRQEFSETRNLPDELPDYAHAGLLVQAVLDQLGISQQKCANNLGVYQPAINQICRGRREITPEKALLFEVYLGIPAQQLLALQTKRKLQVVREKLRKSGALARIRSWKKS